jgi:hypothetical protein
MIGLASIDFVLVAIRLEIVAIFSFVCFLLALLASSYQGFLYRTKQYGSMSLTRPRLWELLALVVLSLYQAGVLLLAKMLLPSG